MKSVQIEEGPKRSDVNSAAQTNNPPSTLDMLKMTNKKELGECAIMVIVNLANVGLVMIKGVAAYVSSSFSIGTSAIESFGDVFVSFLLLVQYVLDKRVKKSEYPRGRSSESTTNLTASVVMMALAFVNFIQSFDALLTGNLQPDIGIAHMAVIICNIIVKVFLFLICLIKRENNQIRVLMRDQLTDVLTNSIALIAVFLAHFYWNKFDFIGASIIFVLIVRNWAPIVAESWFKMQGIKGCKDSNNMVEKVLRENRNMFQELAGYVTYHIGSKLIIEVYCELETPEHRAKIFSKFDDEQIQAVYLLPVDEAEGMSLRLVETANNAESKENETTKLFQTV